MCINAVLVDSMGIGNGFTGVFSLGHVGFVAVGAYVSGILSLPITAKHAYLSDLPNWLASFSLSFLPATLVAGLSLRGPRLCRRRSINAALGLLRFGGDAGPPDHRQRRADQRGRLHARRPHLHWRAFADHAALGGRLAIRDAACAFAHHLLALRSPLSGCAGGHDRRTGDRDIGAADTAFRVHGRRLLRRRRRLALRPLSRLVLAG